MILKRTSQIGYTFVFLLLLNSCWNSSPTKEIDISKDKISLEVARFDKDFFSINATNYDLKAKELPAQYPLFYRDYTRTIMGFGMPRTQTDTTIKDPKEDILLFLNDSIVHQIWATTEKKFPTNESFYPSLENALLHFHHYFPEKPISKTYTFISLIQANEMGSGVMTYGDSALAIALDMYLGSQCPYYVFKEYPQFLIQKFNPEFITPNSMEVLYQLHFGNVDLSQKPLIEAMVEAGKKYYFMEMMMPNAPDSLLLGYSSAQLAWCTKSEKNIWQFFNEKDLLYKINFMDQKKYLQDGPTSAGMPAEAPGKIGAWLGWQIVRKYMLINSKKTSLKDFLIKTDAKTILATSNYKPK